MTRPVNTNARMVMLSKSTEYGRYAKRREAIKAHRNGDRKPVGMIPEAAGVPVPSASLNKFVTRHFAPLSEDTDD